MKRLFLIISMLITGIFAGCVPAEFVFHELPENPHEPLVVAALLPMSGKNRIYAEQMKEGLLMAENTVNNRGGVSGRSLKLEIIDTCGTDAGTDAAVRQAVSRRASGIIAGYSTGEVSSIIARSQNTRIPIVVPLATSDEHTQQTPFVYRNCFSDTQQMEVLAAYLRYWRILSKGAIITDPTGDEEYARGISRKFTQAVKDSGGMMLYNAILTGDARNDDQKIRSLMETDPEFIMIVSQGRKTAGFIKTLRGYGFSGLICGPDSWDDENFTSSLSGVEPGECIFTAFFSDENKSREFKTFQAGFRKRFFHKPNACETQSYDALIFLAIGLNNAKNLFEFDRNWRKIRKFHGAAALYTMLKKGEIDRTIYLKSLAVDRTGDTPMVFIRLSKSLQYSKLQDYKVIE